MNTKILSLSISATNPSILSQKETIIVESDNFSLIYNPKLQRIESYKIKELIEAPIPFLFLQHIKHKNFSAAQSLLSFDISNESLSQYFGSFDIILNNYLQDEAIISIKTDEAIRHFKFEIEKDKIINITALESPPVPKFS